MTLTFPTGLTAFADDNGDEQLSVEEMRRHTAELQAFFAGQIRLIDSENRGAMLTVQPATGNTLSPSALIAP